MKKKIGVAAFYLAAIFLSGCVQPSLKPLFHEKEVFFEPKLVGTWKAVDSNEVWQFSKLEDANAYKLVVTDDGKEGTFAAGLGKIDNNLFLDVFPNNENEKDNDFYKQHVLGMHSFIRVLQIEPTLQIAMVDCDKVAKIIEADSNAVEHIKNGDRIILTADTNDLQNFVVDYGINVDDGNSIFAEPMTLHHEEN